MPDDIKEIEDSRDEFGFDATQAIIGKKIVGLVVHAGGVEIHLENDGWFRISPRVEGQDLVIHIPVPDMPEMLTTVVQ